MAASAEHGLEGIVAKRRASTYRPGQRSPDWRKVKHQRMQEVVIAGWRPGKGRRANRIGSLILAVPDQHGDLQHVGGVGTGFTERMLDHLAALLAPLGQEASAFPTPLPRDSGPPRPCPALIGATGSPAARSTGPPRERPRQEESPP